MYGGVRGAKSKAISPYSIAHEEEVMSYGGRNCPLIRGNRQKGQGLK